MRGATETFDELIASLMLAVGGLLVGVIVVVRGVLTVLFAARSLVGGGASRELT